MEKKFEKPELEKILFPKNDIIVTSDPHDPYDPDAGDEYKD